MILKLGIRRLSPIALHLRAAVIIDSFKNNVHYPQAQEYVHEAVILNNRFIVLISDSTNNHSVVPLRNEVESELKESIRTMAEAAVAYNPCPSALLTTAIGQRKPYSKRPAPSKQMIVWCKMLGSETFRLTWDGDKDAFLYHIDIATTDGADADWKRLASTSARKIETNELIGPAYYYFRVVAVNSNGAGPCSNTYRALVG